MTHREFSSWQFAQKFPQGNPRYYTLCKVATDPLYAAVYNVLADTKLPVLDIGCGMGLCTLYLRERGLQVSMRGLDFDASKIAVAKSVAAAHAPGLVFETSDARSGLPEHAGNVTILDILQYMNADAQSALLKDAASRVAVGGRLVIRAGIDAPSWRFTLSKAGDKFASLVSWMKSEAVVYPRRETLTAILQESGLDGTIRPLWGNTPFNNWLAVFTREQPGSR